MDRKTFIRIFSFGTAASIAAPKLLASEPEEKVLELKPAEPKKLLLIDLETTPVGMTAEEFAKAWQRSNGVIQYHNPNKRLVINWDSIESEYNNM